MMVVGVEIQKINGDNSRCKKYKKWVVVVVDVKNTKNELW
jgi:hypothetical protein